MGQPFRSGTCDAGRLSLSARSPPGVFGPLRGCFPGLDPHRVCPASLPERFGRGFQGQFGFRAISSGNGVRFQPPDPADHFLLQQIINDAPCPACPSPGGILDLIAAIAVLLSPLAGVPKLSPKPLGSVVHSPAQKLLGVGRRPLLQTLFAGFLLFDFSDFLSPPKREKGPQTRPFPAKSACIQLLHKLGGHQFIEPGVLREAVHKGHDGAAALDEAPPGIHVEHVFLRKGTAKSKKVSIHAGLRRLALKSSRRENRRNNKKRQIEHLRFGRMQLKTVFSLFSSPFPKQIEFRKDVKP